MMKKKEMRWIMVAQGGHTNFLAKYTRIRGIAMQGSLGRLQN
jgi:hypothetical protein